MGFLLMSMRVIYNKYNTFIDVQYTIYIIDCTLYIVHCTYTCVYMLKHISNITKVFSNCACL